MNVFGIKGLATTLFLEVVYDKQLGVSVAYFCA